MAGSWWLGLAPCAVVLWLALGLAHGRPPYPEGGFNNWGRSQWLISVESHAMASTGATGFVVSFGGVTTTGVEEALWYWSPFTNWMEAEFEDTQPRPLGRAGAGLARCGRDDALVLFGGGWGEWTANDTWVLERHSRYPYTVWTWEQVLVGTGQGPGGRSNHGMVEWGDGALVFGGRDSTRLWQDTWVFHEPSREWEEVLQDNPPSARHSHGMASTGEWAVVFGGWDADGRLLGDTFRFGAEGRWESVAEGSGPSARGNHAMAALDDSKVVLFGGRRYTELLDDTWVLLVGDRQWRWQELHPTHFPKASKNAALAQLAPTQLVLFGGYDGTTFLHQTFTMSAEFADWEAVAGVYPPARTLHDAVVLEQGQNSTMVVFGGRNGKGFLNDTWILQIYDGDFRRAQWQQPPRPNPPPPRAGHSMASLPNQRAMFFGGSYDARYLAETWVMDVARVFTDVDAPIWTLVTSGSDASTHAVWDGALVHPPGRDRFPLANIGDQFVLMFGGRGDAGYLQDTWVFHASTERWLPADNHAAALASDGDDQLPAARAMHSMVGCGEYVVLFGGVTQGGMYTNDTWQATLRNGVAVWKRVSFVDSVGPSRRAGHAMAAMGSHKAVLYGGTTMDGYTADLWVLETNSKGEGWKWCFSDSQTLSPPPRTQHTISVFSDGFVMLQGGMVTDDVSRYGYVFEDGWVARLGCPSGYFLGPGANFASAPCLACEPGTFQNSSNRAPACLACPTNFTTPGDGATTSSACSLCDPSRCSGQACGFTNGQFECSCDHRHYGEWCDKECPGRGSCGTGYCDHGTRGSGECRCSWYYGPAWLSDDCTVPTGLVLLLALVTAVLGVLAAWLWSRFRRRIARSISHYEEMICISKAKVEATNKKVNSLQRGWKVRACDLTFLECVGRGGFAEVWRGRWLPLDQDVAIKKMFPLPGQDARGPPMFDDAEVSCMLRTRGHPRLVLFLGVGHLYDRSCKCLVVVTEFLPGGSLFEALSRAAGSGDAKSVLPWSQRLQCARDVAEGMDHLHRLGFLHRDLKSPNVLCDGKGRFKLADFGLARRCRPSEMCQHTPSPSGTGAHPLHTALASEHEHEHELQHEAHGDQDGGDGEEGEAESDLSTSQRQSDEPPPELTGQQGSLDWMAPETFGSDGKARYDHKADVYSFGLVLWELLACEGATPWNHLDNEMEVEAAVLRGQRPPVDDAKAQAAPEGFVQLMQQCWHHDPNQRPVSSAVIRALDAIVLRQASNPEAL